MRFAAAARKSPRTREGEEIERPLNTVSWREPCAAPAGVLSSVFEIEKPVRAYHKTPDEAASDGWKTVTAEDIIRNNYGYNNQDDERVAAMNALVAGVRQHGTYKRYMRAPHREFLALRGLAQRGKLSTEHRALNFIAKLGERGVVWHILTYWRPTE